MSSIPKKNASKRMAWTGWTVTILVAVLFVMSAFLKVTHAPQAVQGFGRAGIPEAVILPLGIVELSCLVLYLLPRTVVLGSLLLTGYLGGAVLANIVMHSDFIHALVIGLLVWAGAWSRVPELRNLIPVRRSSELI